MYKRQDDGPAGVGSRNLVVLDIVARNVGADFEPRREFMADFHLEVHLLHLVGADHARLVVVIGADIISGLDVAARKRHVAVIERSGLENQIHPVRVGQRAERILNMLLETRIPRFVAVLAVVVVDAFVEIADIKPRIGHFDLPHVGEAGDSGVEVEINWADSKGGFDYNIGMNFSTTKNKVVELADKGQVLYGEGLKYGTEHFPTQTRVGKPIGAFCPVSYTHLTLPTKLEV